jgi:hypothetical protein
MDSVSTAPYLCDMPLFYGPILNYYSYGIGVTSTVFAYYILSAIIVTIKKGASGLIILYLFLGFGSILGLQYWALYVQDFYKKCAITWRGMAISVGVGIGVGIIAVIAVSIADPSLLPYLSSSESFTTLSLNTGGAPPTPSLVKEKESSSDEKCSKPDDKDDFVCDLYKNGQLITSTVSE